MKGDFIFRKQCASNREIFELVDLSVYYSIKHDCMVVGIVTTKTITNAQGTVLPLFTGISAGFPSPANDYLEDCIDLNKELIKNPSATFYGRVKGVSMMDAGIGDEDILIVDKSIPPRNGMIAVCFIDGEFTLKQVSRVNDNSLMLLPANRTYRPIIVTPENDFMIWGIVTYVIKKMS
jgi:DNA polymerase V